jgi:hypothetical protein
MPWDGFFIPWRMMGCAFSKRLGSFAQPEFLEVKSVPFEVSCHGSDGSGGKRALDEGARGMKFVGKDLSNIGHHPGSVAGWTA